MAFKTSIDGRMEKRLPIAIVVQLAQRQASPLNGGEMTYTDNVSAHGARVISRHPWQTGEEALVTSLIDKTTIPGKVVYCQKLQDNRYCVGLNFNNGGVTWSAYKTYTKT
jgi:hypothetical protein